MNLSGAFPDNDYASAFKETHDNSKHETIAKLQKKVKSLEAKVEELKQTLLEREDEQTKLFSDLDELKKENYGLEQNLTEKVKLSKVLQDLSDDRKEQIDDLVAKT